MDKFFHVFVQIVLKNSVATSLHKEICTRTAWTNRKWNPQQEKAWSTKQINFECHGHQSSLTIWNELESCLLCESFSFLRVGRKLHLRTLS